jgi:hypothetical protein
MKSAIDRGLATIKQHKENATTINSIYYNNICEEMISLNSLPMPTTSKRDIYRAEHSITAQPPLPDTYQKYFSEGRSQ